MANQNSHTASIQGIVLLGQECNRSFVDVCAAIGTGQRHQMQFVRFGSSQGCDINANDDLCHRIKNANIPSR